MNTPSFPHINNTLTHVALASTLLAGSTSVQSQQIIDKSVYGHGPLGDEICLYTQNTREKILALCNPKPANIRNYTITQGGGMKYELGGYRYQPPGQIQLGPSYNPITKKFEISPPIITPGGFGYSPGGYTMQPSKTVWCTETTYFSQKDGSVVNKTNICN